MSQRKYLPFQLYPLLIFIVPQTPSQVGNCRVAIYGRICLWLIHRILIPSSCYKFVSSSTLNNLRHLKLLMLHDKLESRCEKAKLLSGFGDCRLLRFAIIQMGLDGTSDSWIDN